MRIYNDACNVTFRVALHSCTSQKTAMFIGHIAIPAKSLFFKGFILVSSPIFSYFSNIQPLHSTKFKILNYDFR